MATEMNVANDMEFDEVEWTYNRSNYIGFCTECQDWTREMTEPDATGYDCPDCEQKTVIGAEMFLMQVL